MTTTARTAAAVAKLRAWADANYENGADWMVECWSDDDFAEVYTNAVTAGHKKPLREARKFLKSIASIYADRQADARYHAEG